MSLSSEASSDVLFSLMAGRTNPKAIAEHIGNTPGSVVEQLNKLRKEGYVKRTEKDGKIQPYKIDWDNLIRAAIWAAPLIMDEGVMATISGKGPTSEDFVKTLHGNMQLRTFLKQYFEAIAKREVEVDIYMTYEYGGGHGKVGRTIYRVMDDFEKALLHSFPKLERGAFISAGLKDLYEGLKLWYDLCQKALEHHTVKPFDQALKSVEGKITLKGEVEVIKSYGCKKCNTPILILNDEVTEIRCPNCNEKYRREKAGSPWIQTEPSSVTKKRAD